MRWIQSLPGQAKQGKLALESCGQDMFFPEHFSRHSRPEHNIIKVFSVAVQRMNMMMIMMILHTDNIII